MARGLGCLGVGALGAPRTNPAITVLHFVDDRLVYQLIGGHPTINEVDLRRNPLGPLQSWGDHSMDLVR